jgi:hypothetical protein
MLSPFEGRFRADDLPKQVPRESHVVMGHCAISKSSAPLEIWLNKKIQPTKGESAEESVEGG